jgi:hypothetical protein
MKLKLILGLALVIFTFAAQRACGFAAEIQINHANLKTDYSFLKIKTVRIDYTNNPVVFFTVVVIPKDKHYIYSGNLEISDTNIAGHGYIARTSVQARKLLGGRFDEEIPKSLRDKCVVFEFAVAAKYLATSEFRVEEFYNEFGSPADYIFNLKEFADEK